jgi:predicted phage terminase large subunit-like protein
VPRKATRKPALAPADLAARTERLLKGARPGDRLTKEERIECGRTDFQWFCRYYLADYFLSEPASFHKELSDLVDTEKRVVVAAPREHAKSTVVSFAKPLQAICYQLAHFIVLFRDSADVAKLSVDDIRQELESNQRILEDFGDLIGKRKWTEAEFITSNGVKVLGRGRGSPARGLRFKQFRPDLVIVDDIEDDESVDSRTQRDKLERWLKRVVLNIIGPDGRFFMVGTVLHHDSLLMRLMKQADVFTTRLWKAIQDNGKPLWPARWPLARLEQKRLEIGARNFATEFMNDPANEEEQIFSPNNWRYFTDDDVAGLKFDMVGAIDPAIGLKQKNDDTAIGVVGERDGYYYVLRVVIKKLKIQQQIALVLSTCREFPNLLKFGFETIAYQDALKQLVEEESAKANLQVPAVPVDDISSDKLRRISRLAPLAEQGRILFPHPSSSYWSPDVQKCLDEFEALGVSMNAHDDGPDMVERAISLLRGKQNRKIKARLL